MQPSPSAGKRVNQVTGSFGFPPDWLQNKHVWYDWSAIVRIFFRKTLFDSETLLSDAMRNLEKNSKKNLYKAIGSLTQLYLASVHCALAEVRSSRGVSSLCGTVFTPCGSSTYSVKLPWRSSTKSESTAEDLKGSMENKEEKKTDTMYLANHNGWLNVNFSKFW